MIKRLTRSAIATVLALSLLLFAACGAKPIPKISYTVTPVEYAEVDFHTELWNDFLRGADEDSTATASNDYKVSSYAKGAAELSRPLPVTLTWDGEEGVSEYIVEYATDFNFIDRKQVEVEGNSVDIYNLYSGTDYYWRVYPAYASASAYATYTFTTANAPRNLYIDGVSNVRDIGGYTTEDGFNVKQGMLYRGGRWNVTWGSKLSLDITEKGIETVVNDLGIKTELDLRGDTSSGIENGRMTNDAIPEIEYLLYGCTWSAGASGTRMYRVNKDMLKRIFEEVLGKEESYPIYFHCNIGTDRTGMIAYLVNGLLGVPQKTLQIDYLLSNFGNIGSSRSLSGDMTEYVNLIDTYDGATYAEKVENFLLNDLGVSMAALETIKTVMLEG